MNTASSTERSCAHPLVSCPCFGEPIHRADAKRYCVLHWPNKNKTAGFSEALKSKLHDRDFDFRGVWFPEKVSFANRIFIDAVDFSCATFNGPVDFGAVTFRNKVDFGVTTFKDEAHFASARFETGVQFYGAMFEKQAVFSATTFIGSASFLESSFKDYALFVLANFVKEADFTNTTFEQEANFGQATFADYLTFAGNEKRLAFGEFANLNLLLSKIERPDRVSFQNLTIRPHWFAPVNARQFDFLNVKCRFRFHHEIDSLKSRIVFPYGKLARAFRDLAINCEDRHRYKEA
jgi:hypothetical protein